MSRLVIVADAGGTKTEWAVFSGSDFRPELFLTKGINAVVSSDNEIKGTLADFAGKLSLKFPTGYSLYKLVFFGAGCNSENACSRIRSKFAEVFSDLNTEIEFHTDLEGAAVALFGNCCGTVCILGTGSASGFYDGERIVENIPSLGYILGDEGSGAYLGKELLNAYFKHRLSHETERLLKDCSEMDLPEILSKVYWSNDPNRFLGSFVPFMKKYEQREDICEIIDRSLKLFFENNVLKYKKSKEFPVRFSGGLACVFSSRITRIAQEFGLMADGFIDRPIIGLAQHFSKIYL